MYQRSRSLDYNMQPVWQMQAQSLWARLLKVHLSPWGGNFILWRYTRRRMWQGAVNKVDRCHTIHLWPDNIVLQSFGVEPQVFKNMSLGFWRINHTHLNSMEKLNSCCFCIGKFPCKEWRNLVQMTHHILRYGKNLGIVWKLWIWNDLLLFNGRKFLWLVGVFGVA